MVSTGSPAAALPRPDSPNRLPHVAFGPFTFDPNSRLLRRGEVELPLPPRALGILELLLRRAGDVVPRQELIDGVWKDAFVTDTSLAEAISVLRQTLGDDSQSPVYVQTVHRRGYRFVSPVTSSAPGALEPQARALQEEERTVRVSPSIGGQLVPWSAAAVFAAIALAAGWQLTRARDTATPAAATFSIQPAPGTTFDDRGPALAISPRGEQVAWSGCDGESCRLYIRPLNSLDARPLAGTEGARAPFFSPDGEWIGFFADGRIKKIAVQGGDPVSLADAPEPLGATWIDSDIVYAASTASGLMRVSANGGDAKPLTVPAYARGEVRHAWPSAVPGRNIVLFTCETTRHGEGGDLAIATLDERQPRWRTILSGIGLARAASSEIVLFSKGTEIQAVAIDPLRLVAAGTPRTVLTRAAPADGHAHFAVSNTGTLVHAPAEGLSSSNLEWHPAAGTVAISGDARRFRGIRLSPDGRRIAAVSADGQRGDIWVADLDRGAGTRLTHAGVNTSPVWSRDGRTIYFAARDEGPFAIWMRDADAVRDATRVFSGSFHAFPEDVSPDGSLLAYTTSTPESRADIYLLPLDGGEPYAIVRSPFDDDAARFSPDGSMIAYQSAEAGRWEVYVQRLRDGRRTVVSTTGGTAPIWARDGQSLYFQSGSGVLRAAIAQTADSVRAAQPETVASLSGTTVIDIAPDGRLLQQRRNWPRSAVAIVSLDWLRAVRLLLGPPAAALPR